jgi:hypothetical protein
MVPAPLLYPFRGQRGVDTLLVGGALHLLSVYVPVLPLVPVLGYLVVVLGDTSVRDSPSRYAALPPLSDGREILRRGVGGAVVLTAFLLPATVTLLVTVAGLSQSSLSADEIGIGTSLGFVTGSTASLMLAVLFLYLLPAALANYVSTGSVRAAFDREVLVRAARHGAYFYDVVLGLVVGGFVLVVASATTAYAVGFFVAFYGELVAVAFWSRGVSRALPSVTDDAGTEST